MLLISSFLPVDDLNSLLLVNRRYFMIRNDPNLDQTRTATISFSQDSTSESFRAVLGIARHALNANYRHLEVLGLELFGNDARWNQLVPNERLFASSHQT